MLFQQAHVCIYIYNKQSSFHFAKGKPNKHPKRAQASLLPAHPLQPEAEGDPGSRASCELLPEHSGPSAVTRAALQMLPGKPGEGGEVSMG